MIYDMVVASDADHYSALARARDLLENREKMNERIAGRLMNGCESPRRVLGYPAHLIEAAPSRHKTATRLGATPTGHLGKIAAGIKPFWNASEAGVTFSDGGETMKRVLGPVTVKPRFRKWLAIPAVAETFDRVPEEFNNLAFVKLKDTLAALIFTTRKAAGRTRATAAQASTAPKPKRKKPAPTATAKLNVAFWLVKGVTLPQDRDLIPSSDDLLFLIGLGAQEALEAEFTAKFGSLPA